MDEELPSPTIDGGRWRQLDGMEPGNKPRQQDPGAPHPIPHQAVYGTSCVGDAGKITIPASKSSIMLQLNQREKRGGEF